MADVSIRRKDNWKAYLKFFSFMLAGRGGWEGAITSCYDFVTPYNPSLGTDAPLSSSSDSEGLPLSMVCTRVVRWVAPI